MSQRICQSKRYYLSFSTRYMSSMTRRCGLHVGRFPHLRMCIQPDWQAFGTGDRLDATSDLIWLAELLGGRQGLHTLARHEAVFLAQGAASILAAVKLVGGVQQLAAADPYAAACLCDSLLQAISDRSRPWLPSSMRQCAEQAFAALGPSRLRDAAALVQECNPSSLQRACFAISLAEAYLQEVADAANVGDMARHVTVAATPRVQVSRPAGRGAFAAAAVVAAADAAARCTARTSCCALPVLLPADVFGFASGIGSRFSMDDSGT